MGDIVKSIKIRFLLLCLVYSIGMATVPVVPIEQCAHMASKHTDGVVTHLFKGFLVALGIAAVIYCIKTYGSNQEASPDNRVYNKQIAKTDQLQEANQLCNATVPSQEKNKPYIPQFELEPSLNAQKATKEGRLRALGIEPELLPYIKDAKRVRNLLYIQLKTINQLDTDVIAPVKIYHDNLVAQLKALRKVQRIEQLQNEDIRLINNFIPSATCPVQVVRNIQLLNQFLATGFHAGIPAVADINSVIHARDFLSNLIDRNQSTSWMSMEDISLIIEAHNLSSVTSCVMTYPEGVANFSKAQRALIEHGCQSKDNSYPYHLFVIETGDATASGIFDQVCQNYKIACNLADQEVNRIRSLERNKNHFYSLAIQRRPTEIRCFIIDTVRTHDHIHDDQYCLRDQYLCERVLDGSSTINYATHLRKYAEKIVKKKIEDKHKRKKRKRRYKK